MTDGVAPTPNEAVRQRTGWRWWLWLLLIVSLALNLLIVGLLAGAGLARRYSAVLGQPGGEGVIAVFMQFAQRLEPARRAELRRIIAAQRPTIAPLRQEARRARIQAATVVSAEPFDPEAFKRAQERSIEADRALRRAQTELQAQILAQLSSAERREFMSWRNRARVMRGLPPDEPEAKSE